MSLTDYGAQAREALGLPDEWEMYRWEALGHPDTYGIKVDGAVPSIVTRGKYKGHKTWKAKEMERSIILTNQMRDDWLKVWEARTGQCYVCEGSKQEWAGWSCTEGHRYRPCTRCAATGLAPAPVEAPQ